MDGGGHERGNRSGTLNVPGIVGFAKACEIMKEEGAAENERILALRNRLHKRITRQARPGACSTATRPSAWRAT